MVNNGHGGGIFCSDCSPTIDKNIISGNTVAGGGAGVWCGDTDSATTITNNIINGNSSATANGGGVFCGIVSATIIGNMITDNITNASGGGIYCFFNYSLTITNNIIAGNTSQSGGAGICCRNHAQSPTITNNTIFGNSSAFMGGGIWCDWAVFATVTNTILWDNNAPTGPEMAIGVPTHPSGITISYSDVKGGKASVHVEYGCSLDWGAGMIDSDPLFVDSMNGDYHITFPSPCKDTGDSAAVKDLFDFEGDPRIAHRTVDMGGDEFNTHLYWTGDATPGGNAALKFIGLPGTTPVQLWLGSGVLNPPWPTKYGDWYLRFPLLADMALGSIPSPDGVLVFPFTFPANTPTPLTLPFQSGIGMELTNLSVMQVE